MQVDAVAMGRNVRASLIHWRIESNEPQSAYATNVCSREKRTSGFESGLRCERGAGMMNERESAPDEIFGNHRSPCQRNVIPGTRICCRSDTVQQKLLSGLRLNQLCLIGRYGLPVFATGTVLSAMSELVETRSEALSHQVAFGAAIVVGGILMHYLVARGLAAWRDKSRAQQSKINRAHALQMASPLSSRNSAIVLWLGTSPPISPICPSRESDPRIAVVQSGQDSRDNHRRRSLDVS